MGNQSRVRRKNGNDVNTSDLFFDMVAVNSHNLLNAVYSCYSLLRTEKNKDEFMFYYLHLFLFYNGLTQACPYSCIRAET